MRAEAELPAELPAEPPAEPGRGAASPLRAPPDASLGK